jgi:hypothetical protein
MKLLLVILFFCYPVLARENGMLSDASDLFDKKEYKGAREKLQDFEPENLTDEWAKLRLLALIDSRTGQAEKARFALTALSVEGDIASLIHLADLQIARKKDQWLKDNSKWVVKQVNRDPRAMIAVMAISTYLNDREILKAGLENTTDLEIAKDPNLAAIILSGYRKILNSDN